MSVRGEFQKISTLTPGIFNTRGFTALNPETCYTSREVVHPES
jgi:hypothetical protein